MTLTDVATTRAEVILLTLTMTSAKVVETSVNVITNSTFQDYTDPDGHTSPAYKVFVSNEGLNEGQYSFIMTAKRRN